MFKGQVPLLQLCPVGPVLDRLVGTGPLSLPVLQGPESPSPSLSSHTQGCLDSSGRGFLNSFILQPMFVNARSVWASRCLR